MQASKLPSLNGTTPNALQLQRQVARAVGAIQAQSQRTKSVPASAALLSNFFDEAKAAITAIGAKVRTLTITPATVTLTVAAATAQLVVTKVSFAGASTNVAASSTYVSSNPAVATVSSTGLVTRVANGTTTITATNGGVPATKLVTCTA